MDDCVTLHPYRRDRLVLVAPRGAAIAQRASLPFVDTLDSDYIGLQSDCWVSRRSQRAASEAGYTLKMRVQVSSFDALCRMVQAGVGVGLVPYEVFRAIGEPLGLVAVQLDDAWAVLELQIAVPRCPAMSADTAMLLEHLRHAARDAASGAGKAAFRLPPSSARLPPRHDPMMGAAA
jgi:DNA-binding transcriptional LysR family regulator